VKKAEVKTPTLLWQKEFATKINAVAMSADGEYIAVSTDAESIGPTTGEPFKGSKLCFFDKNGNLLWEYEKGDDYQLAGVEMSDDGTYTAVALAKKVVLSSGIIEGEYHETVELHVNKLLFFDRFGNLLWKRDVTGFPQMSEDGSYILVRSRYYGLYHKFFDKEGNLLWQKPFTLGDVWSFGSDLSIDGNYVIIGNTLYNKKGKTLHTYDVEEEIVPVISAYGNYVVFETSDKILCYDKNGVLLWKKPRIEVKVHFLTFSPDENYLIGYSARGKIKFFDKSGRLLWSEDKKIKPSFGCGNCIFTNDNRYFVIGFHNRVYFYNINGDIIWQINFPTPIMNPHSGPNTIAMSIDGRYLAVGLGKGRVLYLYDNSDAVE
jgi:WD40 repeat protein